MPIDWRDENADIVERVWRRVGCAPLVGGHMHYAYESVDRVRVLDVGAWCAWLPD